MCECACVLQVTDRLTIHPVCMTTHKVTPPCLPYDPHHHAAVKDDELKKLEIQAQAASASVIRPTAVLDLDLESVFIHMLCTLQYTILPTLT